MSKGAGLFVGPRDKMRGDLLTILSESEGVYEDLLLQVLQDRTGSSSINTSDLMRDYLHQRLSLTDDGSRSTRDLWYAHLIDLGATPASIEDMLNELLPTTSVFPAVGGPEGIGFWAIEVDFIVQ